MHEMIVLSVDGWTISNCSFFKPERRPEQMHKLDISSSKDPVSFLLSNYNFIVKKIQKRNKEKHIWKYCWIIFFRIVQKKLVIFSCLQTCIHPLVPSSKSRIKTSTIPKLVLVSRGTWEQFNINLEISRIFCRWDLVVSEPSKISDFGFWIAVMRILETVCATLLTSTLSIGVLWDLLIKFKHNSL